MAQASLAAWGRQSIRGPGGTDPPLLAVSSGRHLRLQEDALLRSLSTTHSLTNS